MIYIFLFAFSLFKLDSTITYGISNSLEGKVGDIVFNTATISGNRESILLYSAIFTVIGDSTDIKNQRGALIGGAITSGLCSLIKYAVNRKRPSGSTTRWNSSFPSGHSEMSAFIAVYFGSKYPEYRVPLYLWSLLVGTSRIYLKRHWVSDVIAGYALGALGAYLTIRFYDKH